MFSYYFEGVRYTETDLQFLKELTSNYENSDEIIEGVLKSKEDYTTQNPS